MERDERRGDYYRIIIILMITLYLLSSIVGPVSREGGSVAKRSLRIF